MGSDQEAVGLKDLSELVDFLLHVLFGLFCPFKPLELLLLAVMHLGLFLALLQGGCHGLVLPARLLSQAPQVGKLPCGLQAYNV